MIKILEKLALVLAWLEIFISPFLVGVIISTIIWGSRQSSIGNILAIATLIISIIISVLITEWLRKKKGTIEIVSRINASPELDNLEEAEDLPN